MSNEDLAAIVAGERLRNGDYLVILDGSKRDDVYLDSAYRVKGDGLEPLRPVVTEGVCKFWETELELYSENANHHDPLMVYRPSRRGLGIKTGSEGFSYDFEDHVAVFFNAGQKGMLINGDELPCGSTVRMAEADINDPKVQAALRKQIRHYESFPVQEDVVEERSVCQC